MPREAANVKGDTVVAERSPRVLPVNWSEQAVTFDLGAIRKRRRVSFFVKLAGFIVLPTLLSVYYVFVYATPRYVAEFQIAYQSDAPGASASAASSLLSSFIGGASGPNMSQVLSTYFVSNDFLTRVDKLLDLKSHYSNSKVDWLDRCCSFIPSDLSNESFVKYFTNHRITVTQETGGYDIVDVEAFDPKYARDVAAAMVAVTDQMVTDAFQRPRDDLLKFAQDEVDRTMARFNKATYEITKFQNEHHEIDIALSAGHLNSVVATLQASLSDARASLSDKRTFLSENSPAIVSLKARIASLEQQIEQEQHRLASGASSVALPKPIGVAADIMRSSPGDINPTAPVSGLAQELKPSVDTSTQQTNVASSAQERGPPASAKDSRSYSNVVAEYAALLQEQKYAEASYVDAKKGYDLARSEAMHKQDYILSFVQPTLPQKAINPDPTQYILGTFLASLALFGAGSMLLGAFRERAGL